MSHMNYLEKARGFELKDVPSAAFDCYCQAIEKNEDIEFDDYINFSVLAFLFQDYSYSSSNEISAEQVGLAWSYMNEALNQCEIKYGRSPIINFWKKYYDMILLGELISEDELLSFFDSGVQEAAFCITSNQKAKDAINAFKLKLAIPKTFRERYIVSIIGNV